MQNILQIKLTSTPREYYILDLNKSKQHFQDKQVINDLSDVPGNLSTVYLENLSASNKSLNWKSIQGQTNINSL